MFLKNTMRKIFITISLVSHCVVFFTSTYIRNCVNTKYGSTKYNGQPHNIEYQKSFRFPEVLEKPLQATIPYSIQKS